MKIELLINVPVSPECGMSKGRTLDVLRVEYSHTNRKDRRDLGDRIPTGYWVKGDNGDDVKIWEYECKVKKEK
jgi:hypothetical protein